MDPVYVSISIISLSMLFYLNNIEATKQYRSAFANSYEQEISPMIRKDTVIKVKDSLKNGGRRIGSQNVEDATECYNLCKDWYFSEGCNIAQMHYKNTDDENIIKICYLFACGFPDLCVFKPNVSRFHVIGLSTHDQPMNINLETNPPTFDNKNNNKQDGNTVSTTLKTPHTVKVLKKTKQESQEEECPPGTPMAMCSDDPCQIHTCAAHPEAICKANYCGGCNAKFYSKSGQKLDCMVSAAPVKSVNPLEHNEESITIGESDYEEKPEEEVLSLTKKKNEGKKTDLKKTGDLYYQTERRQWVDQGGEGILNNTPITTKVPRSTTTTRQDIVVEKTTVIAYRPYFTVPLLVALITCVVLLCFVLYRYRRRRGKPKKLPVDDGDYLINGMYL